MVKKTIACLIGLAFSIPHSNADEGKTYLVGTLKSYHEDRAHRYNEKNLGIGLEHHLTSDVRVIVGEYKNSFYNKSEYYGIAYLPFHRANVSAGALLVKVSGYDLESPKRFLPVAVPVISYEKERVILNFIIIPPFRKMGVIGFQGGFRFN